MTKVETFNWWLIAMLYGLILGYSARAHAAPMPLPTDDETRNRLAIAWVAEANWNAPRDYAATGHVLAWRWRNLPALQEMEFGEVITSYVAVFRKSRRTRRMQWVLGLNAGGEMPLAWDMRLSWAAHRPLWGRVLRFASAFLRGRVPDPCGGRARHWGGPGIDTPSNRLRPIDCGDTHNVFYAYRGES